MSAVLYQALELVAFHPLAAMGLAVAAGLASWFITRARDTA